MNPLSQVRTKVSLFIFLSLFLFVLQGCVPVEKDVQPDAVCSSFTYSAYGACQTNNTQSRTLTSSSPAGCTGGSPVLSQSCSYIPPVVTCSSFTYSAYGACQTNNTQSRTLTSSSPAGCTGGSPLLSQSCTYVPPAVTCSSFTYSAYGACQTNNTQSRTLTSSSPVGCRGGSPVLSQSCVYTAPVTTCSSFTYSAFGACQSNNTQSRTLTSSSPAGCTGGSPVLSQSCIYTAPVTTPSECYIAAAPAGATMLTTDSKTLTVTCTKGTLPFSYAWYKNESLQSGITSNAIQLSSLTAGTYVYKVVVSNSQGSVTPTAFTANVTGGASPTPPILGIVQPSQKIYNYAPSAILENGNIYTWTCSNVPTPGQFIDVIGFFINGKYSGVAVDNSHNNTSFDGVHACDPSVIKGNFSYGGASYSYLMAYLGEDWNDANGDGKVTCDNILCEFSMHNQIGVAYSKSITGPWVKHPSPVVTFADRFHWGVGQPSLIHDPDGSIIMFYTKGDKSKTAQYFQKFDFSKSSPVVLTPEKELHSRGIVSPAGWVMQRNSDFALRPEDNRLFMIRGGETEPNSFVQVVSIALTDLLNEQGQWTNIKTIDQAVTGQVNNHNPGLLRSPEGHVIENNKLTTYVTTHPASPTNGRPEWDYTIRSFAVNVDPPTSQTSPGIPSITTTITEPLNNASVNPKIVWTTTTSPDHYWIDLSERSDFAWFWNRRVNGSDRSLTYSASGWGKIGSAPYLAPVSLAPSRTYYVRVSAFDASDKLISNGSATRSFTIVSSVAAPCSFNGQSILSGTSVAAYAAANVSSGTACMTEVRTCSNGVLSGSYANSSCTIQNQSVAISFTASSTIPTFNWSLTASPHHHWVDLSENSDFGWFWNLYALGGTRSVTYGTGWGNNGDIPFSAPQNLISGKTYFLRIVAFDSSNNVIPGGILLTSFIVPVK